MMPPVINAIIRQLGAALPVRCVTNVELEKTVDTSDAWIRERTGIEQRYLSAEGETTSSLAIKAATEALTGIDPSTIDLVIVATSTPDSTMPSTACLVQAALGCTNAAAFDINAACSGFVYGLSLAEAQIKSGMAKRILLIGAESMSRIVDWDDRGTCVLFGDGAGAALIEAEEGGEPRGILATRLFSDGRFASILGTDGGVSRTQTSGLLRMQGQEVFRHGVEKMADATTALLQQLSLSVEDVSWVIPHQANQRIIAAIAKKLGVALEKFIITVNQHANTSAASIPLALADAHQKGQLKTGDLLALPALGAGLTWGCCIIRW